jgi:hypothetical protein
MANSNFNTGFQVYAQARVVNLVSDRQVTDNLRITRIVGLKNQPTGKGIGPDGYPDTQAMSVLVDFKNLTDNQVAMLTKGSLIRFEGELMEQKFQPKDSEAWVSYHSIESWDFERIARSKAERTANHPPVAAPVKPQPTELSYDEVEF